MMSNNNNEICAAIALALYEAEGRMIHDNESGVITIKPRNTPWATPRQIILSK